jgi:hypothetical protein
MTAAPVWESLGFFGITQLGKSLMGNNRTAMLAAGAGLPLMRAVGDSAALR